MTVVARRVREAAKVRSVRFNRVNLEVAVTIAYERDSISFWRPLREVVVLRLCSGMRFQAIARMQGVSINTVQGRYRYGLDKLKTLLNGKLSL